MELNQKLKILTKKMINYARKEKWDEVTILEREQTDLLKDIGLISKDDLSEIINLHEKLIKISTRGLEKIKIEMFINIKKKDLLKIYL